MRWLKAARGFSVPGMSAKVSGDLWLGLGKTVADDVRDSLQSQLSPPLRVYHQAFSDETSFLVELHLPLTFNFLFAILFIA
jgi:hypothetical protein